MPKLSRISRQAIRQNVFLKIYCFRYIVCRLQKVKMSHNNSFKTSKCVYNITYNKIKVQLQFKIQTHMYFTKWMTFFLFSPSRFSPYYIIMRQVSPLYHGTPLNWCNLCLTIAQNHDNYSLKVWWIFIWQQSADELHY